MSSKPALKQTKIQRGLSLPKPLYDRISREAARYGRTWNETVELILATAYADEDLHSSQERSPVTGTKDESLPSLEDE